MTSETVARQLLIILNPAAGWRRSQRLVPVLTRLREQGCAVDLRETQAPGDAERFAAEVDPDASGRGVAASGDGTVNETIDGLGRSGLRLGVIPLGRANVLAAEIGLRRPGRQKPPNLSPVWGLAGPVASEYPLR